MRDSAHVYDVILSIFATSEAINSDETNFPPRSLILLSSLQSAAADFVFSNRHDLKTSKLSLTVRATVAILIITTLSSELLSLSQGLILSLEH
jgi:hypothetical protein